MPGWLALICALAAVAASGYLLFVILFPEKF